MGPVDPGRYDRRSGLTRPMHICDLRRDFHLNKIIFNNLQFYKFWGVVNPI